MEIPSPEHDKRKTTKYQWKYVPNPIPASNYYLIKIKVKLGIETKWPDQGRRSQKKLQYESQGLLMMV